MARMPGATWTPKAISGRALRRKGRCVVLHVAVSEAQNLMPGANADWHFYVAKDGHTYQYIDTDLQSWATGAGNGTAISVETQGGVVNADGEPWTEAQVQSLARICRWAHDTEGIPLQAMSNSLPASKGIGYHRLGVDPWRISGGELWSSSRGKICPGAAKIAQVPRIIAIANGTPIEGDDMSAEDVKQINDWTNFRVNQLAGFVRNEVRAEVVGRIAALQEVVAQLAKSQGAPIDVAAVQRAVEQGVASAIEGIDTTVKFDNTSA